MPYSQTLGTHNNCSATILRPIKFTLRQNTHSGRKITLLIIPTNLFSSLLITLMLLLSSIASSMSSLSTCIFHFSTSPHRHSFSCVAATLLPCFSRYRHFVVPSASSSDDYITSSDFKLQTFTKLHRCIILIYNLIPI